MNDRVVKNPNFKNNGEFHRSLAAKPAGTKDWPNTHTEVEHLGGGKFGASLTSGHRVFFDKADGNKPKKRKLTDERPAKDYILIQSAKCCVEVYPYYAKYFDPGHEIVRLYEERFVIQRLFKTVPEEEWRDVGAWNPVMELKEGDSRVSVTITYQTDYGTLLVRYSQGDGNNLAHHILFVNESGGTETFRALQRWAGIVGGKCNEKEVPLNIETPEEASYLAFHSADKEKRKFNITNDLRGTLYETVQEKTGRIIEQTYWDELQGKEVTVEVEETRPVEKRKTDKCLKLPVKVETHAQGMKADFIFERWTLAPTEVLTVGSPYALDFDGSSYVSVPHSSSLNITGDQLSVEAWIKTDVLATNQWIISKGDVGLGANYYNYLLYLSSAGKFAFVVRTPTGWTTVVSDISYATGTWYYIVGRYDGSNIEIWVNGVRRGYLPRTGNAVEVIDPVYLGQYRDGILRLNGISDEVRISDIARTPEETLANWNDGCGKTLEADEHTVALYHMDEGTGDTIHDESPNGNDGTIHGASWTDGFPFGDDCPDSATLDNPTEDGEIEFDEPATYTRNKTRISIFFGKAFTLSPNLYDHGYVEWDISSILAGSIVTKVEFRYQGLVNDIDNSYIYAMANQPSVQSDDDAGNQVIFDDVGAGTAYLSNNAVFPEAGTGKDVGGASGPAWDIDPKTDVQNALVNGWFAFGFTTTEENAGNLDKIYSEEQGGVDPPPTLYVEYTPPVGLENKSANMGSKMIAGKLI